jgi:hypothetical protein
MEHRKMHIDPGERVEFYTPFAHIPNRYEVCRIHAEGYGSFDVLILIDESTDRPVTVYVNSDTGSRFMVEQYPESTCVRVSPEALRIQATGDGRRVACELDAETGPLRSARLQFEAAADAVPEAVGYGGAEFAVWGSPYYCRGVDLNVRATVTGQLATTDGSVEEIDQTGIIALGSVGILGRRH